MEQRGLMDERHKNRFKKELKEVDAQGEVDYILDLHDRKVKFAYNEHNQFITHLLVRHVDDAFDIDKEAAWVQGELPDVDIDYIRDVRDYLKKEWAPKAFGRENVCEIATYGTLGIKSAILDMTRVYGKSKDEIQAITVKMEDKYDDGGTTKNLDWDAALRLYPKFQTYCEENPEIAEAAKLALDRNKSGGVHAGGLIISDRRIDKFVPLEVRSVKKENPHGVICAAWTEGQRAQDLAPVGLVKYDLLVIRNLDQIAYTCNLVKERHPEMRERGICAHANMWDWSDISYLDDPEALEFADKGDLNGIFQFDGEGIQKLVKQGGVSSFDDLAAYSALYRPGPLNMGMDARFCKRKKGLEQYCIHPLMEPILGKTYGVMIYQEQVMAILRVVGKIPDMHTEKVRKALSKKKVEQFIKYKEQFIRNGQKALNVNREFVVNLWDQIEAFSEYGFNKSHAYAYTYISARLLWLKSHYPIEFYCGTLMCEKEYDKYKKYKLDAENHNIRVRPVDVNKSKENFNIDSGEIYFGFQNIKGLGEPSAKRIVEMQEYADYRDFLVRFGTDATPVKSLTALGCFDELEENHSHADLRRYHEFYKDGMGKRRARTQRVEKRVVELNNSLRELLLQEFDSSHPDFEGMCKFDDEARKLWERHFTGTEVPQDYKSKGEKKTRMVSFLKVLTDLDKALEKSMKQYREKERFDENNPVTLDNYDPHAKVCNLAPEEIEILTERREVNGEVSYPLAEKEYYGFQWISRLETSPDYSGNTIDSFLNSGLACGAIEIEITGVRKKKTKNDIDFYDIDVEDADARDATIRVWMNDYTRFQEEFKKGAMLSIRVKPPSGYRTFSFESAPKRERHKFGTKEEDYRVVVLREETPPEPEEVDLEDLSFDMDAIEGI
jgi:DNA polymerase III alpha subunit